MYHYNKRLQLVRCIICNYKLYGNKDYCNKCIQQQTVYIKIHDYNYPTCCLVWKEI